MALDGIKPEDMMDSLSLDKNRNMVFKAGEGAGQSGSFFFFSHDNQFLIKTLRGNEKKQMLDMLDDYIDHIRKTKNKSLLARIYGIFTFKTNYFDPLDIIVMQNTSVLQNKHNDKMIFDLKGSFVNRCVNFGPKDFQFWRKKQDCKKVMKDLNYLDINNDLNQSLMKLTKSQFDQLEWLVKLDSVFLKNHQLMDYSLLLVIEKAKIDNLYID
jgi:1-phosphatidylinositol-4-phosphate 5-kinase